MAEFAARLGNYVALRKRVGVKAPPVAAQVMTKSQTAERSRTYRAWCQDPLGTDRWDVFTIPTASELRCEAPS